MKNLNARPIRLTTAQFAQLHGINKRTLHYYDAIGLFSPIYKGDNNYRYYDYSQSIELEYILMLKELHMSLEEIKEYLDQPDTDRFFRIADGKLEEIDQEIRRLKKTKDILKRQMPQHNAPGTSDWQMSGCLACDHPLCLRGQRHRQSLVPSEEVLRPVAVPDGIWKLSYG